MNRKTKNTLILLAILIFISAAGGSYSFIYQKKQLQKKTKREQELKASAVSTSELEEQLKAVKIKAMALDSILSKRKYNIPKRLHQTDFYNFVNRASYDFSPYTHIDIEYADTKVEKPFNAFTYKVSGAGEFNDVYHLIYAIEQSKELKKIKNMNLSASITPDKNEVSHYLVSFNFNVHVYFANDDRFTTSSFVENSLEPGRIYDMFYPLIRTQLPPNVDDLAEVESAKLLALVPDGAYIADAKGNTFMLMEGDPVYLGYLTKIDYETNQVTFILNKGGIVEKVFLKLDKEDNRKKK
ncbi:MAG: hypothetical protein HF314_11865 [Ignavibacteria bacterium]|jgi:Tfp pilus assembly protein PilO|nr:hypothetical protein [Ignavibacteria bacterium]MCU7503767.1 hypothetical protein [Ignavibacteria bacterium]MCU7517219.1 hypothetical protein [Ignavibacteria bacterium]